MGELPSQNKGENGLGFPCLGREFVGRVLSPFRADHVSTVVSDRVSSDPSACIVLVLMLPKSWVHVLVMHSLHSPSCMGHSNGAEYSPSESFEGYNGGQLLGYLNCVRECAVSIGRFGCGAAKDHNGFGDSLLDPIRLFASGMYLREANSTFDLLPVCWIWCLSRKRRTVVSGVPVGIGKSSSAVAKFAVAKMRGLAPQKRAFLPQKLLPADHRDVVASDVRASKVITADVDLQTSAAASFLTGHKSMASAGKSELVTAGSRSRGPDSVVGVGNGKGGGWYKASAPVIARMEGIELG